MVIIGITAPNPSTREDVIKASEDADCPEALLKPMGQAQLGDNIEIKGIRVQNISLIKSNFVLLVR